MSKEISLDENILFRRVLDEGVVVDQRKAEVMVVNEVAVRILELIRESKDVAEIVSIITGEYEAEPGEIEADVASFLEQLKIHDMVAVN